MIKKPFALALFAALSTSVLSTVAFAADLAGSYAPPPAYNSAPVSNWSGAYAGIHGGFAAPKLDPFNNSGLAIGGQAGYNVDVGGGVIGGEVEGSYLGDSQVKVNGGELKERHRLAAKVKAGVPLGDTLVYGTTGLAMTNFRDSGSVSGPDGWKPGWILGAGVEQKLNQNLSARVEYNYTATNNVRSFDNGVGSEKDLHDHTVKAGINYHF